MAITQQDLEKRDIAGSQPVYINKGKIIFTPVASGVIPVLISDLHLRRSEYYKEGIPCQLITELAQLDEFLTVIKYLTQYKIPSSTPLNPSEFSMEQIAQIVILIVEQLLDTFSGLKDMELVKELQNLESFLSEIDKRNGWSEIDLTFNDRMDINWAVKNGKKCRKKRTLEQFYRQYGAVDLKEYLSNLCDSLKSYLRKNYNIS